MVCKPLTSSLYRIEVQDKNIFSHQIFSLQYVAFRKKLSRILNMCIEARKCKPDCSHQFKEVKEVICIYKKLKLKQAGTVHTVEIKIIHHF